MKSGPYVRQLWQKITKHNLDARYPDLAHIKALIEQDLLQEDVARSFLLQIEPLVQDAIDRPCCLHRVPTEEELYAGGPPDIELASLVDNPALRFGPRFGDRPRGILIAGNAGAGKTTAMRNIVIRTDELSHKDASRHVSLIILDKKLDYGDLKSQLRRPCLRLSVHDPGTRLSLGASEGVPPNVSVNLVATVFSACAGMVAAWTCFANMIRWLLGVLNPNPDGMIRWPSLSLLLEVALAAPLWLWAAKPDYEKTLIGVLEGATQATELFDCFAGLDLERDVIQPRKHLILEMPDVTPPWLRQFVQYHLFAQVLYGRIHRHQKTDRTDAMFILDEMDQDATFEADRRFPDQMSPLAQLLRFGREYGIMTVIGLGRLSHASPYVLSEPQYHLIFNQSDARSVLAARQTLMLPPEADQMFPALTPGLCIARQAQCSWTHPMLVKVDYTPPGRGPLTRSYDTHPYIPAQSLDALPEVRKGLNDLVASRRKTKLRQARSQGDHLSKHAQRMAHAIVNHPWAPAAALWKLLGDLPSPAIQKLVRDELAEWNFAKSEQPRLGRTNQLLYLATKKGCEFTGCQPPKHTGCGSITHQHVSHWIGLCGEADGHRSFYELAPPGSNHATDCALEVGPNMFDVFEVVVTSTGNVLQHLTALASCSAVRNITIVCLQKRHIAALQARLKDEPVVGQLGNRLIWALAETYLRRCFP